MVGSEVKDRSRELGSEADAYVFLERLRWGDEGPTRCPHCGSDKGAWYLKPQNPEGRKSKGGSTVRSQRRVWKCRENSCRRQFSVLTNTVMHATKMPVRAWVGTLIDLCEDPDGVSARDIAARWEITEKSAWSMLNRIQDALAEPQAADAGMTSNAPVWFELFAADAVQIDAQKHEREHLAERLSGEEGEAERQAVDRVRRDVERVLVEPDSIEKDLEAPLVSTSKSLRFDDDPGPGLGSEMSDRPGQKPIGAARHPSDIQSQVKSDVRRALAGVFGDALVDPAESVRASPTDGSDQTCGAPREGASTDLDGRSPDPQPVEKARAPRRVGTANHIDSERKRPSRVEARRAQARQKRTSHSRELGPSDTLGGGWLGGHVAEPVAPLHSVSVDQGQLDGVELPQAAELGPAWAEPHADLSPDAPRRTKGLDDQLPLFGDGANPDAVDDE